MTFGIFVSHDGQYFQPLADITIPVLREYCARHGYKLSLAVAPPVTRTLVWDRCLTMLDNLDRFDWTLHWDADALVTNLTIRLEDIVAQFPPGRDMILSRDHTGLNDGIVFTRRSPRSRALWADMWAMKDEVSSLGATWRFMEETPEQTIIGEVPQKLFNSYPYAEYGIDYPEGTWAPGDFVFHVPGKTTADRVALLTPMLERIVR